MMPRVHFEIIPNAFFSNGDTNMHDKILVPASEAAAMLSMGKSTFWREVARGNVPEPVKIGGLTRWRVADLIAFVANAPTVSHQGCKAGK